MVDDGEEVIVPPLDRSKLSPFEDSTVLLDDPIALRERAQRDGYLFFRGVIDLAPVLDLRREVLKVLDRHDLRYPGAEPLDGTLNIPQLALIPDEDMRSDIGVSKQIYIELQQLPQLQCLPHHPSLLHLYRTLFDQDVFVHPRHIMRAITPHQVMTPTPPHQDFPLIQGTTDTWTCWLPVGDCAAHNGSLAVLRGSHRKGYLPIIKARGAGSIASQLCDGENDWVGGDFNTGDVLTFSSLTVHRALPTETPEKIRISMDVRYQRARDIIEEQSFTNHADASWSEIYDGWDARHKDLMNYWESEHPPLSAWNASLLQPGTRRIC